MIRLVLWLCFGVFFCGVLGAQNTPVIYRLDKEIGGFGSVLGYFSFPSGIAGDSRYLYIVDSGNNRIVRTDFEGATWDVFQSMAADQVPLDTPWGIAVDGQEIWVSDTYNHRIVQYSHYGIPNQTEGGLGIFEGTFDRPQGLAAQFGNIWIADTRNHRLQRLKSGIFDSYGGFGDADQDLLEPYDIAFLSLYEMVVSDKQAKRLVVFNTMGQWLREIVPVFPKNEPVLGAVRGVCVDQDGRVLVADPDHSRVVVLSQEGVVLSWFSVSAPEDVYAWGRFVFVTDRQRHRVLRFYRQE